MAWYWIVLIIIGYCIIVGAISGAFCALTGWFENDEDRIIIGIIWPVIVTIAIVGTPLMMIGALAVAIERILE